MEAPETSMSSIELSTRRLSDWNELPKESTNITVKSIRPVVCLEF